MERFDLDGKVITPLTICLIGGGGFIGSHLCDKLIALTPHKVIVIDTSDKNIIHLFGECLPWLNRIEFHKFDKKYDFHLESLIKKADVIVNLGVFCNPDYNTERPLYKICRNFVDEIPLVMLCSQNKKRLIHFSSSEVYGVAIGNMLSKDDPLRQELDFSVLKEDASPCVYGPIEQQKWSYPCAKQLIERLIYGEASQNGLEFTIVRPFNCIGRRMDLNPSEVVPRALSHFTQDLLCGRSLTLFDGQPCQHTFVDIKDAIEAILLIIQNPSRANGQIFNVGNPNNGVTRKQLAEMMKKLYAKVSGESSSDPSTVDNSPNDDKCGRFIPDTAIINGQLGWNPKTTLPDLLESTLRFQMPTAPTPHGS